MAELEEKIDDNRSRPLTVPDGFNVDDENIPEKFTCPISHELMLDPVICADGKTYLRERLEEWFQNNSTSPSTGALLHHKHMATNLYFRSELETYMNKHIDKSEEGFRPSPLIIPDGFNHKNVPEELKCPLSHKIMLDPVSCSDGHTYERKDLTEWMSRDKKGSPVRGEDFQIKILGTNFYARNVLQLYIKTHACNSEENYQPPPLVIPDGFNINDVPDYLKCSLSGKFMIDPVVCSDCHTYERKEITEWKNSDKKGSPVRGEDFTIEILGANWQSRQVAEMYMERQAYMDACNDSEESKNELGIVQDNFNGEDALDMLNNNSEDETEDKLKTAIECQKLVAKLEKIGIRTHMQTSAGKNSNYRPNQYRNNRPNQYQNNRTGQYQNNRPNQYQNNRTGQYQNNRPNQYHNNHSGQYRNNRPNQYHNNSPNQYQNNHSGQYQNNHSGQYRNNHSGQYQNNHSGQYQNNHSGQYQNNRPHNYHNTRKD